jgi:hypothetical protein
LYFFDAGVWQIIDDRRTSWQGISLAVRSNGQPIHSCLCQQTGPSSAKMAFWLGVPRPVRL